MPDVSNPGVGRPHVALAVTALHGVSGGAERVLVDVANGLHRRGFRVTVLTYQARNGPSFYPLDYGITQLDARQRHVDVQAGGGNGSVPNVVGRGLAVNALIWLLRYGPRTWRLRRLLRIARPDVAIGFLPSSFTYLTLAASGTGVRTIASVHNVPDRDLGGDPDRWDQNPVDVFFRRRALRRGDANTVLLSSFLDQLDEEIRGRTAVIPNMIHPYHGELADVSDSDDQNTVLAVGRLSPAKDHATLVRAWARIEKDHPTWRLRIIGDGLLLPSVEALISELGLERAVVDPPTKEIEEAYRTSKFLVMSSVYEGFGLVTAEAMACGLPVVGFADCEGTNEIVVHEQNGLLVEPGNDRVVALADAMSRMIVDEPGRRRLAAGAPATVEAFEPGPVIEQWERLVCAVHAGEFGS